MCVSRATSSPRRPASFIVKAWSFSTDSHPRAERADAWRDAMSRLGLPIEGLPDAEPASASVVCLTSPLGIEFALVEAGAQAISGRLTGQPAAIWLAVLLGGEAQLVTEYLVEALSPGDIAYGPTGEAASLRLETRCRLMFVRAPRVALDHRLIAPVNIRVDWLDGAKGGAHILSALLRATADNLEDLTVDQLRPVELSLTEFLAICLVERGAASGELGGASSAHLQRLCQTTETLLPDPGLSLRRVADEGGLFTPRPEVVRLGGRDLQPLPAHPAAGALPHGPGQSAARQAVDLRDLLPLALQRLGAFKSRLSRPIRHATPPVPSGRR